MIREGLSIKINKLKMIRINQKINKAKLESLEFKSNQVVQMTESLRKFLLTEDHKKSVQSILKTQKQKWIKLQKFYLKKIYLEF